MSDASENAFHPPTDGRSEIDVLRLIISAATLCDNYRIVGGFLASRGISGEQRGYFTLH